MDDFWCPPDCPVCDPADRSQPQPPRSDSFEIGWCDWYGCLDKSVNGLADGPDLCQTHLDFATPYPIV